MALTPPKYDWQHWNDAGIAVGAWVEQLEVCPNCTFKASSMRPTTDTLQLLAHAEQDRKI